MLFSHRIRLLVAIAVAVLLGARATAPHFHDLAGRAGFGHARSAGPGAVRTETAEGRPAASPDDGAGCLVCLLLRSLSGGSCEATAEAKETPLEAGACQPFRAAFPPDPARSPDEARGPPSC